jgi:hypothetical protein
VNAFASSIRPVSARLVARTRDRLRTDARVRYLAVSALFAGLVVALTWPVAADLDSGVPGGPSDVPNGIRVWSSLLLQHGSPFTTARDHFINALAGVPVNRAVYIANGLFQGFWWFGGQLIGWIAAYNVFDLGAFAAAGVATFVLFDRLGFGGSAALFGAYVFAFNPNHVEKFYSSAPLVATGVLPLLLLALFAKRRDPTAMRAVAVGAMLLVAFYLNSYLGLLALWLTGVFVVVDHLLPAEVKRRRDVAWSYYFAALVFVFGMIPVAWSWIGDVTTVNAIASDRSVVQNGAFASAHLYLVPGPRNPWFGGPMRHWLQGHLSWEGTMFFGYTTMALAICGVGIAIARRRSSSLDREASAYVAVAVLLVITGIWASLPPTIDLAGVHLPVPAEALRRVTTLFRIFSRFGVLVGLGEIMLAVFALAQLRRSRAGVLVAGAALVFVAVELHVPRPKPIGIQQDLTAISIPEIAKSLSGAPLLLMLDEEPQYVRWLARHPGGIVADYPRPGSPDLHWEWKDAFAQTFHHHALWQTTSTSSVAQDVGGERHAAADLSAKVVPDILADSGVRWVVVHADHYRLTHTAVPKVAARCGLVQVASFSAPSIEIYRVSKRSARGWIVPGLGFYSIANDKLWPESAGFTWIGDTATFTVYWPISDQVLVSAPTVSLGSPRQLRILNDAGSKLGEWEIGTSETTFSIPLNVQPGLNRFTVTATPPARIRGYGDGRRVSVAMRPLQVRSADGKSAYDPPPAGSSC